MNPLDITIGEILFAIAVIALLAILVAATVESITKERTRAATYHPSMLRPDGTLRRPGETPPERPPLVTEARRALYDWEVRTRRAERELGRDASRQPKGSGPRVDATNVQGFMRLNQ